MEKLITLVYGLTALAAVLLALLVVILVSGSQSQNILELVKQIIGVINQVIW